MAFQEFLALPAPSNKVAVLITPRETPLGTIAKSVSPRPYEIIEDHHGIAARRSELMSRSKFARVWEQAGALIRAVAHVELALEMPTGEKYSACYYPNISAPRSGLPEVYIIDEDEITDDDFSSFVAPFSRLPEAERPRVIIRAKGPSENVAAKLSGVRDKTDVRMPGLHGLIKMRIGRRDKEPERPTDALTAYQNFGFAIMAEEDVTLPPIGPDPAPAIPALYRLIFKINAAMRAEDRSKAEADVLRLGEYLDAVQEGVAGEFRLELARIKTLSNLLHAYVFESSAEQIRNALALANQLRDPFLIALGTRLINLAEGLNPSTLHWLEVSERSFWQIGEPVQAIYAMHNRLLTSLSLQSPAVEFAALLDHADRLKEIAPYAERLSTISQGVGMLHLVSDNISVAHGIFEAAEQEPGTWLHRAEARTSKLMCRNLMGYADDGELLAAAASFARQLGTTRPGYHHHRLFYNLLRLSEGRRSRPDIIAIGVAHNILSSDDALNLDMFFASIAARMPVSAPGGRYQGARGNFFERTLLAPACSFIWH